MYTMKNRQHESERQSRHSGRESSQPGAGAPGADRQQDIQSGTDRGLPTDRGSQSPMPGRSGSMGDEERSGSTLGSSSRRGDLGNEG
jgi:hypothetical protein